MALLKDADSYIELQFFLHLFVTTHICIYLIFLNSLPELDLSVGDRNKGPSARFLCHMTITSVTIWPDVPFVNINSTQVQYVAQVLFFYSRIYHSPHLSVLFSTHLTVRGNEGNCAQMGLGNHLARCVFCLAYCSPNTNRMRDCWN